MALVVLLIFFALMCFIWVFIYIFEEEVVPELKRIADALENKKEEEEE